MFDCCNQTCCLFSDLHKSQKCVIHSLASCFLRRVPVMLPEGLSSGRRTCKKQNVSKEAMSYISRLKMSANDRNYLIFVDDAHFFHIYDEVMLVWHNYLNFFHLLETIFIH